MFFSEIIKTYKNGLFIAKNWDYDVKFVPPPYVYYEVIDGDHDDDLLMTTEDLQEAKDLCENWNGGGTQLVWASIKRP